MTCPRCVDGSGPHAHGCLIEYRHGAWWYGVIGPYEDESAARQAKEHAEMER